jgi:hypothetical protein
LAASELQLSDIQRREISTEIARVTPNSRAVDLVMMNKACKLLKISDPSQAIHRELVRLNEKLPGPAIVSLIECLDREENRNVEFLEYLAEQTRSLRLDVRFNDLGCLVIAKQCAEIGWKDPRVLFQIVHFVNTHTLRKECFLPVVEAFAKLRIPDDKPWRKFVARFEKIGPELSRQDIRKFESCMRKAKQLDDRSHGIIQLLKDVKDDVDMYGAC